MRQVKPKRGCEDENRISASRISFLVWVYDEQHTAMARRFNDPLLMPDTDEQPKERLAKAACLAGTPGQTYVERRGIFVSVADEAGVRFDADFDGRPAVLVPLRDHADNLVSVHGRYLHNVRHENKMLTIGQGGGVINVLGGWRADPLILVEGLFDGLSLAMCDLACIATIGRWALWLPEIAAGRTVYLGFDASKPGEADVAEYSKRLKHSEIHRLLPPARCKDWNTALRKIGRSALTKWLHSQLVSSGVTHQPAL
ncbi:MAG: hypothetical protein HC853_14170 [Anaerolineae bacterium]|nr:hypothetical protein [Anaerolineae bacterium]